MTGRRRADRSGGEIESDPEARERLLIARRDQLLLRAEESLKRLEWSLEAANGLPEGWREVEDRHPTRPTRSLMTIRLDADVAAFWRAQGRGYQARINAVLRLYMMAKAQGKI